MSSARERERTKRASCREAVSLFPVSAFTFFFSSSSTSAAADLLFLPLFAAPDADLVPLASPLDFDVAVRLETV